ncbi:hypothetical protein CEXT_651551 [Caerostris extrusa]|uniref:Uncharacterized protein n=1 Tax=Caerostris extrusa TaxID=172846 RepID=A0AAV4Q0W0_CAEEX|nr:hypothetical protein CEXT_651551 [Caerostris extrusa]
MNNLLKDVEIMTLSSGRRFNRGQGKTLEHIVTIFNKQSNYCNGCSSDFEHTFKNASWATSRATHRFCEINVDTWLVTLIEMCKSSRK